MVLTCRQPYRPLFTHLFISIHNSSRLRRQLAHRLRWLWPFLSFRVSVLLLFSSGSH